MSLRQKYLKILSEIVPAGAAGVSLLLGATKGIPDEILDRHKHGRHNLRILACRILGGHMGNQQAGVAMDKENMLNLVD